MIHCLVMSSMHCWISVRHSLYSVEALVACHRSSIGLDKEWILEVGRGGISKNRAIDDDVYLFREAVNQQGIIPRYKTLVRWINGDSPKFGVKKSLGL